MMPFSRQMVPQARRPFQETLAVYSAKSSGRRQNLNQGNKILLPSSALQQLIYVRQKGPMMFRLSSLDNPNKFTYVGVLEFISEEGTCIVPDWICDNLQFFDGMFIHVQIVDQMPAGKLIKIQPHETAFVELPDPRAILENQLRYFVCLTEGETITLNFNDKQYQIDIVEVQPKSKPDMKGVCINETDVEIDFLPPLDYQDVPQLPLMKKSSSLNYNEQGQGQAKPAFFQGQGVRLDGKQGVAMRKPSEDVKPPEQYDPRKKRLQNGVRKEEFDEFKGTGVKIPKK